MLTRSGWGLSVATVALLVAGWLLAYPAVIVLGVAGGLALVSAVIFVGVRPRLEVDRAVEDQRRSAPRIQATNRMRSS